MKGKTWFLILVVLVVLGGGAWFWSTRLGTAESGIRVQVVEVTREDLTAELKAEGTIELECVQHVTAQVAASVQRVLVEVGQQVKEGQLLAELDTTDYQLERNRYLALVEQARENLGLALAGARPQEIASLEASRRQAEVVLNQSRRELERLETLLIAEAVTEQEVEKLRLEVARYTEEMNKLDQQLSMTREGARPEEIKVLEAKLAEAEAGLAQVEKNIACGRVVSPVTGYVLTREVQPGKMLAKGMDLFTLGDKNDLIVEAEVEESKLWVVQTGQEIEIRGNGFRGKRFQGRVKRIAPVAENKFLDNEESHYIVTVVLEGPELNLVWPGMTVRAHFQASSENALIVPADALVEKQVKDDQDYVWVKERNLARRRQVEVGLQENDRVEILAGLKEGEEVILAPSEDLQEGAQVRIPVG